MPGTFIRSTGPRRPADERVNMGRQGSSVTPKGDDRKLLDELGKRWTPDTDANGLIAFHRQWWQNVCFFAGLQWNEWTRTGEFARPNAPSWRVRYTANLILPKTMRAAARLAADKSEFRVMPETPSREDQAAARQSESILDHLHYVTGYSKKRLAAIMWSTVCGSGFLRALWRPSAGGKVQVVTGDAAGNQKTESVDRGEAAIDSFSPFSVRVPPYVADHADLPWFITVRRRPMELIWRDWPERAHLVTPSSEDDSITNFDVRATTIVGARGAVQAEINEASSNFAREVEIWSGPTSEHPSGFHGVVANGTVVSELKENEYVKIYGELPELAGCGIPFEKYDYFPVPGRYWGMSLVEAMIQPQAAYNATRSMTMENARQMGRAKWSAPKGHGIIRTAMTTEPGELIEYNQLAGRPEVIPAPPMPTYILEHGQQCLAEMQEISAQQDASEGKAPASIRSGIAVQMLQAASNETVAVTRQMLLESDRGVAQKLLLLARANYTEPRMIAVVGADQRIMMVAIRGDDMRGNLRVRIFAEGGLLDTKAARQQNVMDFASVGLIDVKNPDERIHALEALDSGDIRSYVQSKVVDERAAEMENVMMSAPLQQGEGPVFWDAKDYEGHETHIEFHNLCRKESSFRLLPPEQQENFAKHVAQHQQFLMQQQAQAQAAIESTRGAPGEKGKPSPVGGGGSSKAAVKPGEADAPESGSGGPGGSQGAGVPPGGGGAAGATAPGG